MRNARNPNVRDFAEALQSGLITFALMLAVALVLEGCVTRGGRLESNDTWPPRAVDTDPPGAPPAK
jgi:hypothetical protein